MDLSPRAQNALLGALAAAAVGASGFAVWTVNRPHPSLDGAADTVPASAFVTEEAAVTEELAVATEELAAATTEPVSTDDAGTTASPTDGPATTSAPGDETQRTADPVSEDTTVEQWVTAWEDEADLLVVGDGYGNLRAQWVQEWASVVAQDRPVQIRHWGEAEDWWFTEPVVLSEGDGPELRVWSASRAGTSIADATERLERFGRASGDPEAVLVSLGLDSGEEDVPAAMDELLAGLDEVPVLLSIAPEGFYPTGVADDLLAWAQDNAERVAVLDLRDSELTVRTDEEWAQAFAQALEEAAAGDER